MSTRLHTDKPLFTVFISLLLIVSLESQAALIKFTPEGAQLDTDPINDIATDVGNVITFNVIVDTTGLSGLLQTFSYEVFYDLSELLPLITREEIDVEDKFTDFTDDTSHVNNPPDPAPAEVRTFKHLHSGGNAPVGTSFTLDKLLFRVQDGLVNDGRYDFKLDVVSAIVNGVEEKDKFTADQEIEVQPPTRMPEPTTLLLMGFGLAGVGYKRHLSKT